jgi:DNA mismatch repair protein MutL
MGQKIQILDSQVVDQIAAGEVVERPAHMVKELCENSLDAGATELTIDFRNSGRDVTIRDNGMGMSVEDLALAVQRHATSKIRKAEDIWGVSSFGFRGEALASIAAVSHMTILTRQTGRTLGSKVECQFGKLGSVIETGADLGTTVTIQNLFDNVPARLKFLKSESGEHAAIKTQLKGLALTHPQVSFRIIQNGELIHFWPATDNKKERVESILEISPLYRGFAEVEGYRAEVFVSSPNDTVGQSRQIWLFVQQRYIQDRGLQAAAIEAYRQLLMHGEYPYVAAFVECDPGLVDVNVSPSKSQVKFQNSQNAFRVVQRAVRGVLEGAPWLPQMMSPLPPRTTEVASAVSVRPSETPVTMSFQTPEFSRTQTQVKNWAPQFNMAEVQSTLQKLDAEVPAAWSRFEVLGQAHHTYILAQSESSLMIVDQHAAHERVIFERLMAAYKNGNVEVQNFLLPLQVKLNEEAVELILQHQIDLQKLGLTLEQSGPDEIAVTAAPAIVKTESLTPLLEKLADDYTSKGGSFHFERVLGDLMATMACHSAVRAGQTMTVPEMQALLAQMDEHPLSSFCPHGRPVFVDYPFRKLEKDFGRIV